MKSFTQKSKKSFRYFIIGLLVILISISLPSCKKYLDEKTNKKLVVPETLQDVQALLDFYSLINAFYPSIGVQSDDDTYLSASYWNTLSVTLRNNYVWEKENYNNSEWDYMYQVVLNANLALETLSKIQVNDESAGEWKRLKGAALFYRAYAFYQVAQYYAVPYKYDTTVNNAGIPLRLSPDINLVSTRSSLAQTYEQIINDYKEAANLLPLTTPVLSRPSKAAAFGALARTFLIMQDYLNASLYADSCLSLQSTLIDYNTLDTTATYPLPQFNAEVIFPSVMLTPSRFSISNCSVDTGLYRAYNENDLRKAVFFTSPDGIRYAFRGSYDGTRSLFNGIAVDEIYLISAECNERLGFMDAALIDLNTLLEKRWVAGTFTPLTLVTDSDALKTILNERRKEMILRGSRWFDLRRLNTAQQTAQTLTRDLDGTVYNLLPGDLRYTQYIPASVIALTGIQQNIR